MSEHIQHLQFDKTGSGLVCIRCSKPVAECKGKISFDIEYKKHQKVKK